MECVAEEVKTCIQEGSFGGRSLMCFRGVPQEKWVFSDDKEMQAFLAMNEEAKPTRLLTPWYKGVPWKPFVSIGIWIDTLKVST